MRTREEEEGKKEGKERRKEGTEGEGRGWDRTGKELVRVGHDDLDYAKQKGNLSLKRTFQVKSWSSLKT